MGDLPIFNLRAMRGGDHQSTAYALAALIDNSVQAEASKVEVIGIEARRGAHLRARRGLAEVGVLDNGSGMSPEVLRMALQFGNGTHLDDRTGLGRFGVGLPDASASQCRRVDVWTWQKGPDKAVNSHLDFNEMARGAMVLVPKPLQSPLPKKWRDRAGVVGASGTLVVWSRFEEYRLTWLGAQETLENTATLFGRIYRKFLDQGRLAVRFLALQDGLPVYEREALANDPLYLMSNSATPPPFATEPMFERWKADAAFPLDYGKAQHQVVVRMSLAKQQTVPADGLDRGSKLYGKHASSNVGLSILRAGRELGMDAGWVTGPGSLEPWWGAEVDFPPALDEIFGVDCTKQGAHRFSRMAQYDWQDHADEGGSESELHSRMQDEGDPNALLIPIADYIRAQLADIRRRLEEQTSALRSSAA